MTEKVKEEGAWLFRLLTPVLVALCLKILTDMQVDFKEMRETVIGNKVAIAVLQESKK